MTLKTRAELKSENAADFPDNSSRLISPADLRGQMDDIADSMFLAEDLDTPGGPASFGGGGSGPVDAADVTFTPVGTISSTDVQAAIAEVAAEASSGVPGPPGPAGDVRFVDSIAEMRALAGLAPGSIIFVGDRMDQFVVVDDDTLGTDGGTVFIPDSELSSYYEEVIPPTYFVDATFANCTMAYDLAHTGIDFESVELVLSDAGETIDIWTVLHGHVYSPGFVERADPTSPGYSPQLPLIDTGQGKFRDPAARLTRDLGAPHPPLRTGGALLRYKYATSGLRLKRITGPVFQLSWWPVVAVDEEAPGEQTDNSGKICWCANAAAKAGAEAVLITKMYYYNRVVEWPNGVEMRGLGPGVSGFRVVDNGQFKEMLLSTSADGAAHNQTLSPLSKPATRLWTYDAAVYSQATCFFPATGSTRTRISGIEFDGNIENNLRIFTERENEYAWKHVNTSIHMFNTTSSAAFANGSAGNRVIPPGNVLELHNVKMHGYSHLLLGNHNSTTIGTGVLELGNVTTGHWMYLPDGVFETVRCFGYNMGDALRCRIFHAKSVELYPKPHPEIFFFLATLPADERAYATRQMYLVTANQGAQVADPTHGGPHPILTRNRLVIEYLFADLTGLDEWPQAYAYEAATMFWLGADDFHIKSGKIRYGRLALGASLVNTNTGSQSYGPFKGQAFENLRIEYGSRGGFLLNSPGAAGDTGPSQLTYRNITVEQLSGTTNVNNPVPNGISSTLGSFNFGQFIPPEPSGSPLAYTYFDGRDFEFSAVTVANLAGDWIDITPSDAGAPTYRVWFDYNGGSTAPSSSGVTLVEVDIVTADTPATTAAKFSAAIAGTPLAAGVPSPYLTASTFGTKSAVGSYSEYRGGSKWGFVGTNITNATGVTTTPRGYHRTYEPSYINFESYIAPDPINFRLFSINAIAPTRDVYFSFKDCVLGGWHQCIITLISAGAFTPTGDQPIDLVKDQIHLTFENTVFDFRHIGNDSWTNTDLTLYCSKYRNCRIRTPMVATGLTNMGPGYEWLVSEQSDVYTVTPGVTAGTTTTTIDIQTKLFWLPKPGQIRIYPADPATAVVWNTNMPSVEWRKSARPVTTTSTALGGGGAYYQGPAAINEDRRAPVLRLNFASALAATPLKIGWSAAVSP